MTCDRAIYYTVAEDVISESEAFARLRVRCLSDDASVLGLILFCVPYPNKSRSAQLEAIAAFAARAKRESWLDEFQKAVVTPLRHDAPTLARAYGRMCPGGGDKEDVRCMRVLLERFLRAWDAAKKRSLAAA